MSNRFRKQLTIPVNILPVLATGPVTGPASVFGCTKIQAKMPATMPTLLVIDDLMVPLHDWGRLVMDIGLYAPKLTGSTNG
ncbi:MAG: hypothetical protein AABY80_03240, partial [Candidatus Deferrimicrobiota bacterium]